MGSLLPIFLKYKTMKEILEQYGISYSEINSGLKRIEKNLNLKATFALPGKRLMRALRITQFR